MKIELEAFSEGGTWPPDDDSWFWDTRKVSALQQGSKSLGGDAGGVDYVEDGGQTDAADAASKG